MEFGVSRLVLLSRHPSASFPAQSLSHVGHTTVRGLGRRFAVTHCSWPHSRSSIHRRGFIGDRVILTTRRVIPPPPSLREHADDSPDKAK